MTSLTDFLLARIADDRARAMRLQEATQDDMFTAPASLINLGALVNPARVLAECEAKRKIVEWYCITEDRRNILRALATIYADHPDFQPEWAV